MYSTVFSLFLFGYIFGAQLTGTVPVALGACRRLSRLSLADNRLEGDLPTALVYHWIHDDSLTYVNLSGNPLLLLAAYDPAYHHSQEQEEQQPEPQKSHIFGGNGQERQRPMWNGREDFIAWNAYQFQQQQQQRSSFNQGGGRVRGGDGGGVSGGRGKGPMVAGILESDLVGAPAALFRKLHRRYGAASMASAARGLVAATEGRLEEVSPC
jgi:hypothetical protein